MRKEYIQRVERIAKRYKARTLCWRMKCLRVRCMGFEKLVFTKYKSLKVVVKPPKRQLLCTVYWLSPHTRCRTQSCSTLQTSAAGCSPSTPFFTMPPTDDDKQPTNQPDTTKSSQRQESILASAVSNIHLNEPTSTPSTSSSSTQPIQDASQPRPLIIYSRIQMLALSKSPLVKPPDGMPPFKTWYGYVV